MKYIQLLVVTSFAFLLSGCFTFTPQPGMSLKQVNDAAYVPCPGSMKIDDPHLVYVGNFSDDPTIKVYRTAAYEKYRRGDGACTKNLYFQNGVLLSDEKVKQIKDENNARRELKISQMRKYIDENRLKVIDRFQSTPDSEFKIYINSAGQYFYTINYAFVDKSTVLPQVKLYEDGVKRDADIKAKAAQAQKDEVVKKEQQKTLNKLNEM